MKKEQTHIIYADQVERLNTKAQNLYFENDSRYSKIAKQAFDLADKFLLLSSPTYLNALNLYSTVLFDKEEMEDIISLLKGPVDAIDIDLLSPESKDAFSSSLNNLGVAYTQTKKFQLGAKFLHRSIRLKTAIGMDKNDLIGPYQDLINTYTELREYDKIETCILELQHIIKELFGSSSTEYRGVVMDHIRLLHHTGNHSEASEIEKELNAGKYQAQMPEANPFSDESLEAIKHAYAQEDFQEAKRLHRELRQNISGIPLQNILELVGETFDPLMNYAAELDAKAQKEKAVPNYEEVLHLYRIMAEIVKNSWNEVSIKYAMVLSNWAGVTREMGNLDTTESLLLQAARISRLPRNRMHEIGGVIMDNLADCIHQQSLAYAPSVDSSKKITAAMSNRDVPEGYSRSLRIQFSSPKKDEPRREVIFRELNMRAVFYTSTGQLGIALRLKQDRTKLSRVIHADEPESVLEDILDLHRQHLELGHFHEADKLIREALEFSADPIFEGDTWPIMSAQWAAAHFYFSIGDTNQSIAYFKKAIDQINQPSDSNSEALRELKLRELKRELIRILLHAGRKDEAMPELEELMKEKEFNLEEDPLILEENASMLILLKKYKEAEALYLKALTKQEAEKGKWDMDYGLTASNLATLYRYEGRFNEAIPLYEQVFLARKLELGPLHPKLNLTLVRLLLAYVANGETKKALSLLDQIERIDNVQLDTLFSLTSDKQKFEIAEQASTNMHVYLSLIASHYIEDQDHVFRCLKLLQKRKGNIVSYAAQIAEAATASTDLEVNRLFAELKSINELIADGVYSKKWNEDHTSQEHLRNLIDRKEQLEAELSGYIKLAEGFDSTELHRRLLQISPEVAILEIVKFRKFNFNAIVANGESESNWSYGIFVITNRDELKIKFIDLGKVNEIDAWVEKVSASIPHNKADKQLHLDRLSVLFEDISLLLDDITNVAICPDGTLTMLPYDLLSIGSNQRWVDRFQLSLFESTAVYLRVKGKMSYVNTSPVVVAYPDYFYSPGNSQNVDTVMQYMPLYGALREGEDIMSKLGAVGYFGKEATKRAIQSLKSPVVLHIATHGFYSTSEDEMLIDPMVHSGLALTGANITTVDQSGILTAKEVSFMDLKGTELVVLSACSTGQGQAVSGQGIFGLQQGFRLAGALRVVVALWEIPDWATRHFMNVFYTELENKRSVGESLRLAKKKAVSAHPHSDFWAGFVLWGDGQIPFELTSHNASNFVVNG